MEPTGLYAFACQVKPDTTPQSFWDAAARTAVVKSFGKIITPAALLDDIGKR